MKENLSGLVLFFLLFIYTNSKAQELYQNEEAKFNITLPGEYLSEKEINQEGITTITVTCDYGGMTIVVTSYIYLEAVSEDNNMVAELTEMMIVASALGSKFKPKGVALWAVGQDSGWTNKLKTSGDYKGYIGSHYVIVSGLHYYSILILGHKKTYDPGIETNLVNSFNMIKQK